MGEIGGWSKILIGANKGQTSWQKPEICAKNNANKCKYNLLFISQT